MPRPVIPLAAYDKPVEPVPGQLDMFTDPDDNDEKEGEETDHDDNR